MSNKKAMPKIKNDLLTLKEVKKIFEKINLPDIPIAEDNESLANWVASQLMESINLTNQFFSLIYGKEKEYYSEYSYDDIVEGLVNFFQSTSSAFLKLIKMQIQEKQKQN